MPRSTSNRDKYDFTVGGAYDSLVYEYVHTDMESDEFERQLEVLIWGKTLNWVNVILKEMWNS